MRGLKLNFHLTHIVLFIYKLLLIFMLIFMRVQQEKKYSLNRFRIQLVLIKINLIYFKTIIYGLYPLTIHQPIKVFFYYRKLYKI